MTTIVAKVLKAATGSLLAGSMLMTAMPASAQYRGDYRGGDYHHGDHGRIGAGEVIAGAIVLGGIAAILSSGSHDRNRDYDNRRYNDGYRGYDNGYQRDSYQSYRTPRQAIQQCVAAVQNDGRRGNIDVRQVTDVQQINNGCRIRGDVTADNSYYGGRGGYDRYDNRGNDDRYQNSGSFSCTVRYGRVEDVDVRGV